MPGPDTDKDGRVNLRRDTQLVNRQQPWPNRRSTCKPNSAWGGRGRVAEPSMFNPGAKPESIVPCGFLRLRAHDEAGRIFGDYHLNHTQADFM